MNSRRDKAHQDNGNPGIKGKGEKELCYGKHAVTALLEESPRRCLAVYIAEGRRSEDISGILTTCRREKIPFKSVPRAFLDKECAGRSHQGIAARVAPVQILQIEDLQRVARDDQGPALYVLLDRIKDPGNLGAIIRSAEVFGASGVLFPKWRSAMPTGTVLKTSAGAAERMSLYGINSVTDAIGRLKASRLWVFGLDQKAAVRLDGVRLPERLVLVAGSEGRGLTAPVRKACDETVKIPMRGTTASLNVATATAIGMYEWLRAVDKQT
jgi:23S rRNA (guanosine2251-2'-O)-methyltransferase